MNPVIQARKDIHVSLETEVYDRMKVICFTKRLSLSEILNEFASLLVNDNTFCVTVVDKLFTRKLKSQINELQKKAQFSVHDQNAIYSLLDAQKDNKLDESELEDDT
jgi:hypothetical protein